MTQSAVALLAFASWSLLLLLTIVGLRTVLTLTGKAAVDSFAPNGEGLFPFAGRLARAHANCVENLPIFAAIVGVAMVSGHEHITSALAPVVVGCRVAQSLVHLTSTRRLAVLIRFGFFLPQVAIAAMWCVQLARVALSL